MVFAPPGGLVPTVTMSDRPIDALAGSAEATRLYQELQQAHAELQRAHAAAEVLDAVGKELFSSLELNQLVDRIARAVVRSFADWCVVDVVEDGGEQIVAVAHADSAKEELARQLQRRYQPITAGTSPMLRVLDGGEPLFIGDYKLNRSGMPDEERDLLQRLAPTSIISVRLAGRRGPVGVMSFLHSVPGRHFSRDDLALAGELAGRVALAVENAQLHRQTERAAADRDRAGERQRFLAEASGVLDASLDQRARLDLLAHLTIPVLCDWCVIDLLDRGKLGQSLAIAHADSAKVQLARELQRRWPPDMDQETGVARVIRSGEPELLPDIPEDAIQRASHDPERRRILHQLGPLTSAMIVPLKARGRTLGAMTLISAESGRRYGADDLDFALALASRAALAVDNVRLYERAQNARVQAERLQVLAQKLVTSLEVWDVLQEIASAAAELLGAPVAGVFLQSAAKTDFKLVAGHGFAAPSTGQMLLPYNHSLATQVVRTGKAEIIEDARQAPVTALPELVSGEAIGSLLVAPILSRSATPGVIEVYAPDLDAFGQEDADLLLSLAATAGTALENARAYAAEQRARKHAERLQALTEQLAKSVGPDEVLDQIAATAADLLESAVAGVFLLDASGDYFDLVAGRGFEVGQGLRLPRAFSLAGKLVETGQQEVIADVRLAPVTALPKLVSGQAVGSLVVAPIMSTAGPLGVIEVYSAAAGAFDEHHGQLLSALAGPATAVLENARLNRQRQIDLARLQTIVEQLPVGVVVVEASSGSVTVRNRQAERLFGSDEFLVSPFQSEEQPLGRALAHGEVVSGERTEIERPDGGRSHLAINAAPIRDESGAIVAAVAVFDDVSDEEELQRQKEQFLSAAAHDLKTPLTAIQGLAQVLERQISRLDLPQADRTAATLRGIGSSTRKMTSLIDELLDISRLETTQVLSLNPAELDLVELAAEVVRLQAGSAQQHTIELQTELERLDGRWDEPRLERVLANLVQNAIKYSPGGGMVRVALSAQSEAGQDFAVVAVSDDGIGIPAGDAERVFERFQRGSNVPENLSGSGVGLSYVREIVERHGGTIRVESEVGKGTTFTIRLPRGAR